MISDKHNGLSVHFWDLPSDLYINLKGDFHDNLCNLCQEQTSRPYKNCMYKILNCPKWHSQRLFNREIRFTIRELLMISEFLGISNIDVEENIETIGNYEDGTIIKNPKFPFNLRDLFYVTSHLFFDGSFRDKKGCYFYVYDKGLLEYHKNRLRNFGEVPMKFLQSENQLYFSYTLGYIGKSFLEIDTFKSTKGYLSEKFKRLCKENKLLTDELIKSMILDEGSVEEKIKVELSNKRLIMDLYDIISKFYKLRKSTNRTRNIYFKTNSRWHHNQTSWTLTFSSESHKELYESISPLPIGYKQEYFEFLNILQNRTLNYLEHKGIKKSIIRSLLEKPKTIFELSKERMLSISCIRGHINGSSKYSLKNLGIVDKIDTRKLIRGGYTEVGIYGVIDKKKSQDFLDDKINYKRNIISI